ncbi:MAG: VanW family protein [Crocinitomicaceae bacterium]|nr:VanW family protein [Crocinitomicaceae bacterium]
MRGEIFSFWHCLGKPTASKGFLAGRNIIGNSLSEDIGGGLCQVSGILYHLALLSGLEILERHNHTIDLYQEHERYTPIGTDATVVFAYKDFRFKNSLEHPVSFLFDVTETSFSASICSDNKVPVHELRFEREDQDKLRKVKTFRTDSSGKESCIHLSVYKL